MSEKINFEKIDYQDRVLNSKEKYICEDWERGKGKTTTLLRKVLKPNTEVLWVTSTISQFTMLKDILKNDFRLKYEFDSSINRRKIIVHLEDGECVLYNVTYNDEEDISWVGRGYNVDNIAIDEIDAKFDYELKQLVDGRLKDKDGQMVNLYTSIKNHIKDNEEYYARRDIPNIMEKKITSRTNGWEYIFTIADEISSKIKPGSKIILATFNFSFKYLLSAINSDRLSLIRKDKAVFKFDNDDEAIIRYIDLSKAGENLRGSSCTDLFILGIDEADKRISTICENILRPFIRVNEKNKNRCSITNIYVEDKEEKKTDRYKILDNQINILLGELNSTPKSSNTTMTREKLIGMIDSLYRIKEYEGK